MLSFLSQNIFFPTKQTIHIARSCIPVLSLKNMDWINGLWDGWKTVWKWISCTKSNWKPSPSGGPQGLILEPILLSIFGRTDPQQATAGCGEVGDSAHSGCQAAFQKPSRGWRNGQPRTNEFQRQVQISVFGRGQPHKAVQAGTDWLESSSAERKHNLKSPGWQQVEDVTSKCLCSRDSQLHAGLY